MKLDQGNYIVAYRPSWTIDGRRVFEFFETLEAAEIFATVNQGTIYSARDWLVNARGKLVCRHAAEYGGFCATCGQRL